MGNLKNIISSLMIITYACTVMYLLLDVHFSKLTLKRKISSVLFFVAFLIFNIAAQLALGYPLYAKFYLFTTQLPVYILFNMLSEYRGVKIFFVLLTAVFFSSPIMLFTAVVRYFVAPPFVLYLALFLLSALLIKRFLKEPFNYMLKHAENSVFFLFVSIPLLYYIYNYSLTRYQFPLKILSKEFFIQHIPLLIVLVSYVLLALIFKMMSEKAELINAQYLAAAQLKAATEQIERLRINEEQSSIYRHDLRHHMNYLNTCISDNKIEEASAYIMQTCENMDRVVVKKYSKNEPINLILSSYVSKARENGISIRVNDAAMNFERFHITDLCSLLANALENAINASVQAQSKDKRFVKLRMYEKNNKLCIDIRNNYIAEPTLEAGIPVSQKSGHGIGIKSMVHVIEKYEGIYKFSAEDGVFTFQVSM